MSRQKTVIDWSLYHRWSSMKQRCNPNIKSSSKYHAGKGIQVCPEWQDYKNFQEWAVTHGYSKELTLDRINGDDDYYPDNCRWVDAKAQANNPSETTLREREAKRDLSRERPKKKYPKRIQPEQQRELDEFNKNASLQCGYETKYTYSDMIQSKQFTYLYENYLI